MQINYIGLISPWGYMIIVRGFWWCMVRDFRDNMTLDWYERLGVNVLFVDGNHETMRH